MMRRLLVLMVLAIGWPIVRTVTWWDDWTIGSLDDPREDLG